MDIDVLRTFLEVARTRHFGKASKSLFVTTSTVSARIKMLEDSLDLKLFDRRRNDITLTKAGEKLLKQAETIVNLWEETRQNLRYNDSEQSILFVGSSPSLLEIFLQDWLEKLRQQWPDLFFKGEVLGPEAQIHGLLARTLDIGLMFEPPKVKDLKVVEVAEFQLVLLSSKKGNKLPHALSEDYLMMDWGTSFFVEHSRNFGELPQARIQLNQARSVLDRLLLHGGSAYLPKEMVKKELKQGKLHLVAEAPLFQQKAFALYNDKGANAAWVEQALRLLVQKESK